MEILNRSAILITPRQPYLEWARKDDDKELAESVFEAFHEDPSIYLLPEWEDPPGQQEVLEEFWPGWVTDEGLWSKNRTFEMFREWFDVEMSSIVEDLHPEQPLAYL